MGIFKNVIPLILASGSPRRRELLAGLGLHFTISKARDEVRPIADETPAAYALRAAEDKARKVRGLTADKQANAAILAADTIVVLDGIIYGKPSDAEDALRMLSGLAGRTHTVYTACCLLLPENSGQKDAFIVESSVEMWPYPLEVLSAYSACGEPMDKAGGYAVQGAGAFLVKRLEGSWTGVVGLPVAEVTDMLLRHKLIEPAMRCVPEKL